jgi:hypothetical protein
LYWKAIGKYPLTVSIQSEKTCLRTGFEFVPTGGINHSLNLAYTIERDPKAVRARFVVRVTSSGRIGTADAQLGQQASANPAPPKSANP